MIEETAEGRDSQQFQAVFKFRLFAGLLSLYWCHNNDVIATSKLSATRKSAKNLQLLNAEKLNLLPYEKTWSWENWNYLFEIRCVAFKYFNPVVNHYFVNSRQSQNLSAISETLRMSICSRPAEKATVMLVTSWCWWLKVGDNFWMLVTEFRSWGHRWMMVPN